MSLSLSLCVCMCVFGSEKRPSADQQRHAPFGGIVAARWRHVQDAGIIGVFINDMLTDVSLEKVVAGFADAWAINTYQLLRLLFEVVFMPTLLQSTRSL